MLDGSTRDLARTVEASASGDQRAKPCLWSCESGLRQITVPDCWWLYTPTHGRINSSARDLREMNCQPRAWLRQKMQMIFQDQYASLTPRWRVADSSRSPYEPKLDEGKAAGDRRVDELLQQVRWPRPTRSKYRTSFPGAAASLSIARALAPSGVLVCDEPTPAIDVSVQAQVLN